MTTFKITHPAVALSAAAFVAFVGLSALSPKAKAGGLIGDLIEGACGNCGVGKALDRAHKQLGRPLDRAGAAAVDSVAPGVGTLWQLQDEARRMQGGARRGAGGHSGGQFGNFCSTPRGRFGPGPVNPIGMQCNVMTPFGPVFGRVTR